MAMHNPPHPGSILKEDVLPDLNLTVTDAAGPGLGCRVWRFLG
jgi:plasmid maintenance system antidote protein VapI